MAKNHILIVDDERRIRSSLASILIDEGYLVSTAEDGLQAIEMIKRDTPDLVMLDIWPAFSCFQECLSIVFLTAAASWNALLFFQFLRYCCFSLHRFT